MSVSPATMRIGAAKQAMVAHADDEVNLSVLVEARLELAGYSRVADQRSVRDYA